MPTSRYDAFAVAAPGLAPFVAGELRGLAVAHGEPEAGGVPFTADAAGLYAANLNLRTASRVLVRLAEFRASNFHELERRTARVAWEEWLAPGRAVALRVTCRKSRLYHSGAVAQRVGEALARVSGVEAGVAGGSADAEGEVEGGAGPNEDGARQLVVVRLLDDRCTISLDSSGALLHRRGYRQAVGRAPLRETLAAAMLLASGWDVTTPLVDPFCGSGTIPIEGALMARRIAPGRDRVFAFQQWPHYDGAAWRRVFARAREAERPAPAAIVGSDRDAGAIEAARANAERGSVGDDIAFERSPASALAPPEGVGAVVTNPPYGVRVAGAGDLRDLFARFGAVLGSRFAGWRVAVLSADPRLTGQLGMRLEERLRTSNGGIDVRLVAGVVEGAETG